MTLREALAWGSAELQRNPELRADAHRDALVLLLHALGISRAAWYADPDRTLTPGQQTAYEDFIRHRLANQPVQYLTGQQEFYGLALGVSPAVLIPRPETEQLVEAVLAELAERGELARQGELGERPAAELVGHSAAERWDRLSSSALQPLRILDVGTGSGAIAIALAHHLPQAQITAVDLSAAALAVAAANAARHNLRGRIRFLASDLLDALVPRAGGCDTARLGAGDPGPLGWDAVVSNPPYVPTGDRDSLAAQVRDHEPAMALFAGTDGLDVYRRLIPQARAALRPGGLLALEIGYGQREAIAALLEGWSRLRFLDDLRQIPRIVLARRPGNE